MREPCAVSLGVKPSTDKDKYSQSGIQRGGGMLDLAQSLQYNQMDLRGPLHPRDPQHRLVLVFPRGLQSEESTERPFHRSWGR